MFSHEPRCIFRKNQLGEVICQFRFPEILIINTETPAQFQEMIRDTFPLYTLRQETCGPQIRNNQGALRIETPPATNNHQFSTADNNWCVNLTSSFISLSCSKYIRWEQFAKYFDLVLSAFIKAYSPAYFTRVGLRYLNFISREKLSLNGIPFKELLKPQYLGILSYEDIPENVTRRCTIDAQVDLPGGCTLKVHAGPGLVKRDADDNEVKFIFDQDLFIGGNIALHTSTAALNMLHNNAYSIFCGAITETLFDAMDPQPV